MFVNVKMIHNTDDIESKKKKKTGKQVTWRYFIICIQKIIFVPFEYTKISCILVKYLIM